jgi:hypothetical protein
MLKPSPSIPVPARELYYSDNDGSMLRRPGGVHNGRDHVAAPVGVTSNRACCGAKASLGPTGTSGPNVGGPSSARCTSALTAGEPWGWRAHPKLEGDTYTSNTRPTTALCSRVPRLISSLHTEQRRHTRLGVSRTWRFHNFAADKDRAR